MLFKAAVLTILAQAWLALLWGATDAAGALALIAASLVAFKIVLYFTRSNT